MLTSRVIVYNKDLQILTGKSEKTCYRMLAKIRASAGKESDRPVTLYDVCDYLQLKPEVVRQKLS